MGSLVFEKCYADSNSAADAYFSAKGASYTAGATSYQSWFEKVGGVWTIQRQSIDTNGIVTNLTSTIATVPTFPACDETAMFFDGMAVGWGLALLLVIAWGFNKMREQVK